MTGRLAVMRFLALAARELYRRRWGEGLGVRFPFHPFPSSALDAFFPFVPCILSVLLLFFDCFHPSTSCILRRRSSFFVVRGGFLLPLTNETKRPTEWHPLREVTIRSFRGGVDPPTTLCYHKRACAAEWVTMRLEMMRELRVDS